MPEFPKHKPVAITVLTCLILGIAFGMYYYRSQKPLTHIPTNGNKTLVDYWQEATQLTKSKQANNLPTTVTFLAVGDISLSRNIAETIKLKNDPLYPFRNIDALLKSTDFNFGNLETPFSKSNAFTPNNTLVFNAPKKNVAGLKEYNFQVLNLANNHAFDQGLGGITITKKVLDENGLLHMGTGQSLEEAWQPAIIEKNGIKIGFLGASYSSINDGGKTTNNFVARIEDTARLTAQVSSLKSHSDFIVITMHAGTEYTDKANDAQVKFAHTAIDAGADIVIGAHPHWVQNKELYCPQSSLSPSGGDVSLRDREGSADQSRCKWIYYSLGNFIFDQAWSEKTKQGLALKITLSKSDSPPFQGGVRGGEKNVATISNLQPANPHPATHLDIIQEIPITIKENCCPIINDGGNQ